MLGAQNRTSEAGLASLGSLGLAAAVAHEVRRVLMPLVARAEAAATTPGLSAEASLTLLLVMKAAGEIEGILDLLVGCRAPARVTVAQTCHDLFESDPFVRVQGDIEASVWIPEAALRAVLLNLVENAKRACGSESIVEILIRPSSTGNTTVQIVDCGPGLRYRPTFRLFDPNATGCGIGLPLCRALVEEYGGSLEIHRRAAGGTAAILHLPADSVRKNREAA